MTKGISQERPDRPQSMLFLGTQMTMAGAQHVLLSQARWFHSRGYRVTASFFYDKQGVHGHWQDTHAFPIVNLKAWKAGGWLWANYLRLSAGMVRLFILLLRGRFEAVETFTTDSNLLGIPAAWLLGVPVRLATHHGVPVVSPPWRQRAHGWLVNRGLASLLVAVSERLRQVALEVEGVRPERVKVIPNGIELEATSRVSEEARARLRRQLGVSPEGKLALTVGRLTVEKGHTHLLEAIPRVLAAYPETVFAFAGEGPLRPDLERKAAALGVQGAVRFLGIRSDVPVLLKAADLFVLPSITEGLPLALLEAMSAGLPVVATDVGGTGEVIDSGTNGLVVPVDESQEMAAALVRLLGDETERKRMGEAGSRQVAENYSARRMCERYERLIVEIYNEVTR